MLTGETITRIRDLRQKGVSIEGIAKQLNICTWSVQKQLRTAPKKPLTIVSPGETKSFISIIDKLSKRVEVLEIFKQETEQHINTRNNITTRNNINTKNNITTIKPTEELEKADTENTLKEYHTTKEVAIITGKSERRIQDICKELAGKNMGIDKPGRPYRITEEGIKAIENVIKTSGRAKKNINKKLDVKIEP